MALAGKVEANVELKSPAAKYYKVWRAESHQVPTASSKNIQAVKVHEGDWDQHGAVKIWNYTVEGKPGVFKEKVEFDDANLTFTLHGLEGDVLNEYKVYRPVCKLIPKQKGSLAKLSIEYEKYKASDPNPDKYLAFFISLTQDIDAHVSGAQTST